MSTLRVTGSRGIVCTLTPIYAAPLSNAAWAVRGMTLPTRHSLASLQIQALEKQTHISGSVIPLTDLAQSRYVFTAITMDSVPPDVIVPAPSGLLYNLRHIDTISASIFRIAGNTSGCSGLETAYRSHAAKITRVRSAPPSGYDKGEVE